MNKGLLPRTEMESFTSSKQRDQLMNMKLPFQNDIAVINNFQNDKSSRNAISWLVSSDELRG